VRWTGTSSAVSHSRRQDAASQCDDPSATSADSLRDPRELRFIDCAETLQQLQQFAVAHRWLVPVFVKIDAGNQRAGVPDAAAFDLVAEVHELGKGNDVGVQLLGIYSHSGHAYACTCLAEAQECAADECRRMAELCERLEKAGIQVPVISVGSVR
jgi:D-serine deaminase-like pyridoxal phosphate-dependent protein